MILTICIVVAVIVIVALVRMNTRSVSSPSEEAKAPKRNSSKLSAEEKKEEDPLRKTETAWADNVESTKPASVKDQGMNDQAYRQALRTFKNEQPNPNQTENNSNMNDDAFRQALRSMKKDEKKD